MDLYTRHKKTFFALAKLLQPYLAGRFNLSFEEVRAEGPILLVSNHVSAWDPLLIGLCLAKKHAYFVASEHLFRQGFVTKLLNWTFAPIPRRKGAAGMDTVKSCLRHLRAGHSVCLFAEGEQTWDGLTSPIFPATGKLAKSSGASLVTFRLEGAYLSLPRWAKRIRRGAVHAHPIRVYSPAELRGLSPGEVNALIQHDIHEDAWDRQRKAPVAFLGRNPAEGLERALYACPSCSRIGTLQTHKDHISCVCGFRRRYTETGFFEPAAPFETIADWDKWQRDLLQSRSFQHSGSLLFSDSSIELRLVRSGHTDTLLEASAELRQFEDCLDIGGRHFPLSEIHDMAQVLTHLLLFSFQDDYYQLRSLRGANLRKYLEIWKERS